MGDITLKQKSAILPLTANEEHGMDLLLWRHAEAEDGFPDATRRLTPRGEKQAQRMARWILAHAPKNLRIVASPATRCQQTAAALGLPFETDQRLSTSGNVADLLAVAGWPESAAKAGDRQPRAILIVGHQPTLGRTAASLLSGHEEGWEIKKGALWWLTLTDLAARPKARPKVSLTPQLADKIIATKKKPRRTGAGSAKAYGATSIHVPD